MERRGYGLGCIVTLLGLALSCCLLPYLVSSIYAIVSAVLQVPGTPSWLWGDWLGSLVGTDTPLYMVLAEGPVCCVGALGLLIVILGVVATISAMGRREEEPSGEYEVYPDPEN
jgi:hypothetical protein